MQTEKYNCIWDIFSMNINIQIVSRDKKTLTCWNLCSSLQLLYKPKWRDGQTKFLGFPGGSEGKESTGNAGELALNRGSRRSPGEENGKPLQYSFLENSMDRGARQALVHGVAKSRTWLSN